MLNLKLQMDDDLPLREVVFNTLRQAILRGDLKPKQRLMEVHLADKLGVSRTPIREAIRMLELEGLVIMLPRRGAEVASISRDDLKDVLEVRNSLDTLAVSLACERITDEELVELENASKAFEEATRSNDSIKIAEADVRFHDIIHTASKNNRLCMIESNLAERVYRYRLEYIKELKDFSRLVEEHRLILDYIKNHQTNLAVEVIDIHIKNQMNSILASLEK